MLIIHERTLPNRFFWLSLCHPAMPCNCFSTRTKPGPFVVTSICQPYCNISLTHTRQSAVDFMPIKAFECQDFTQGIPVAIASSRVLLSRARSREGGERKNLFDISFPQSIYHYTAFRETRAAEFGLFIQRSLSFYAHDSLNF